MPENSDLSDSLALLLSATGKHDRLDSLLTEALPEGRALTRASGLAVLCTNPPRWEMIAGSGLAAGTAPTEVAAEALDREATVVSNEWVALPLGDGCVLVARRVGDRAALDQFAAGLAAAMKSVRVRQQREGRLLRLEKILEITHAWRQTNSMPDLLNAMAQAATELFTCDRASIFLWDRARKELVGRPALGVKGGELRFSDDTGIVGQVVHSGEPRRVGGGVGEEEIDRNVDQSTGYTTRTILCVPLVAPNGRILGAFEVLNKKSGQFTDDDERGLTELSAHAAVALQNTQEFEELLTKHQQLVEQAAQGINLIGASPAIEALRSTVRRIADTDLAILILGENGTGKEVVAR